MKKFVFAVLVLSSVGLVCAPDNLVNFQADLVARVSALEAKMKQSKVGFLKRACRTSKIFAVGIACGVVSNTIYQKNSEYYQQLLQNVGSNLSNRFAANGLVEAQKSVSTSVKTITETVAPKLTLPAGLPALPALAFPSTGNSELDASLQTAHADMQATADFAVKAINEKLQADNRIAEIAAATPLAAVQVLDAKANLEKVQ